MATGNSRPAPPLCRRWSEHHNRLGKSGALDNLDVSPAFGPALQLGADWKLSEELVLNLDTKWNGLTTDLSSGGNRITRLKIDPLTLGLGIGFRF